LKSRMLGKPLVRFWEGRGGNRITRAPRLLDPRIVIEKSRKEYKTLLENML
jgi:hypothetical protein